MLTERTNILLSREDYNLMKLLSKKQNRSMGSLIREAIHKVYKKTENLEIQKRKANVSKLEKLWEKQNSKSSLNYKELIEHGRTV